MSENKPGISRRAVTKGAAWAVPAVAVAAAAPAYAKSGVCITYSLDSTACKWPGAGNNWSYHLVLKICNTCTKGSQTVSFTIDHLQNVAGKPFTPCGNTSTPITINETIEAGKCATVILGDFSSESSAGKVEAYDANNKLLFSVDAPPKLGDCAGTNPCIPV